MIVFIFYYYNNIYLFLHVLFLERYSYAFSGNYTLLLMLYRKNYVLYFHLVCDFSQESSSFFYTYKTLKIMLLKIKAQFLQVLVNKLNKCTNANEDGKKLLWTFEEKVLKLKLGHLHRGMEKILLNYCRKSNHIMGRSFLLHQLSLSKVLSFWLGSTRS